MKINTKNLVRWNVQELTAMINTMRAEVINLLSQIRDMRRQRDRINVNWQSEAGRMYQIRLRDDIQMLEHIRGQLAMRSHNINTVTQIYTQAEECIGRQVRGLPQRP